MTDKEKDFEKILELIASGKLPKELFDEYLSETKLGFMNFEDLKDYFGYNTLIEKQAFYNEHGIGTPKQVYNLAHKYARIQIENDDLKEQVIGEEKIIDQFRTFINPFIDSLSMSTDDGKAYIDCCDENPILTLDLYNDKDFQLFLRLKEILDYE